MNFIIPKHLKEEAKFINKPITIYAKDVLIVGACLVVFYFLSAYVHIILIVPYWIFASLSTIFFILPAQGNEGKRNWEAIYIMFCNISSTYRSLDYIDQDIQEEEEEY